MPAAVRLGGGTDGAADERLLLQGSYHAQNPCKHAGSPSYDDKGRLATRRYDRSGFPN
jgi:hypothetical protein